MTFLVKVCPHHNYGAKPSGQQDALSILGGANLERTLMSPSGFLGSEMIKGASSRSVQMPVT